MDDTIFVVPVRTGMALRHPVSGLLPDCGGPWLADQFTFRLCEENAISKQSLSPIPANEAAALAPAATIHLADAQKEVDGSQAGSVSINHPVLLIGQKLPTGLSTLNYNAPIAIGSVAQAVSFFGAGSMLARMVYKFLKRTPAALLYCAAVADPAAGIAATGSIAFTGPATASGTYPLYVAGQSIPVQVLAGQTAAQIATNVAAAINGSAYLPVTAVVASGAVNLTCKWAGSTGNDVTLLDSYLGTFGGEVVPAGMAAVYTAMSGGTGVPDLTSVISAMGDNVYDYVALPYTDAASLTLFDTEYGLGDTGRWGYLRELYGCVWSVRRDTYSNLMAWGPSGNSPVESVMAIETGSPSPVWEWASVYTAAAAAGFNEDPARPLQTLELTGILPAPESARFTKTQLNNLASVGLATQTTAPSGAPMILRETLRYQVNSYGQSDTAYELATTLYTLAEVLRRLKAAITSKYPRHKIANDGTLFAPGQAILTPKTIKAELVTEYGAMEFDGLVENVAAFKNNLIVERNTSTPTRVDVVYPPNLINGMRIFAVLAQFRLQVDGTQYPLRGSLTVMPSQTVRSGIAGQDRVHGYSENPIVPYIEGDFSLTNDWAVEDIMGITNSTVQAELANGRVYVLSGAWQAGDMELNTKDGQAKIRFEDAFGDKVDTLTLREPTGGDIMAIGNPVEFDPISDPPRIKIDDTRMGNMIARLANVPPSSLRSMVPKDMINLGWILSNFFMPI
eukprot:gene17837-18065_t